MIKGLQKTTLVDYPGKIACTIFLAGCNFKCGYCYNSDLVFDTGKGPTIPDEELIEFLESRKNILEGVCITGGEPTLDKGLVTLIKKIKKLGYCVKLDTNGSNPEVIKELLEERLVDYIAMDIKASLDSYDEVTSVKVNKQNIKRSIEIIKNSQIEYEFRTTAIPDIINENEIKKILELIKGSKKYFIQQFKPDGKTIDSKYNSMEALPKEKLNSFKEISSDYVEEAGVRA